MTETPSRDIAALLRIMAALRTPETGCPWDLEQSFETIVPYTIEEAYEVADAVQRRDWGDLTDELGDLLLQVVFHARMAEEEGHFDFGDVLEAITDKLIRRHPHVFGADADGATTASVRISWEEIKAAERAAKAKRNNTSANDGRTDHAPTDATRTSVLDDVPVALPALMRAEKLQKRAARIGFDWPDSEPVIDKVIEEIDEVRRAEDAQSRHEEIGDLLFAVTNLARHLNVDSETALRDANDKFARRFRSMERRIIVSEGTDVPYDLNTLEALWQAVKADERARTSKDSRPG
ncbi:MAG: nucleoside triphosphate pyrophosphohydrolase [Pseudomonadota bacterium]